MLIGRAAEWAAIEGSLRSARESAGRAVLLRGEAGVGKTALLDRAASETEFRVLRATGVEAESDLAYATAHQLLYPLLPLLDQLPETQANAVRVALGTAGGSTPDRFLVALGFLSLNSEAAREGPVLLVLDDVQWWDAASLDALLFLTRRIAAEPVAVLLAVREPGPYDDSLPLVVGVPGLLELPIAGLPETEVGALMSAVAGVASPEPVNQMLAERTHGNPLALVELIRVLTLDQITGREPLPDTLSLGERLERPFLQRAAGLSEPARDMLLVAAAEPSGALDVLAEAARVENIDQVLEEIEAAGLARYDGRRLLFSHPVARSAVYADASATERHAVHLRIAETLLARGEDDRAVLHRAAATLGVDDKVATALDGVAEREQLRSGYASAAAAYERASELSATRESRVQRLIAAADAAWLAGQPARARLLVDRAEPLASEAGARARLLYLRARDASRRGKLDDANRLFLAGAELARDTSPGLALELLAEAVEIAAYSGDRARLEEIAELAATLPTARSDRERFLAAWVAVSRAGMSGQVAPDVARLREELALVERLEDPRLTVWAGISALNLGDAGSMHRFYVEALEQARGAGAAASLPYVLERLSMSLALGGNLAACRSGAEEGLELAVETEQQRSAGQLLATLAFAAAMVGDEADCLRHAEAAREICVPLGIGLTSATITWALSELDLGLGRYDQAVDRLMALATAERGLGHPVVSLWSTPDLVEAAARSRRTAEVGEAVARVVGLADASSRPGAMALASWCQGLLGGPGAADDLAHAAEALGTLGYPMASARARLALGELLRRDRQPRAAREHLRVAQDAFRSLGAQVWTERAAAELSLDPPMRSLG